MNVRHLSVIWLIALIGTVAAAALGAWMWHAFFVGELVVAAVVLIDEIRRT